MRRSRYPLLTALFLSQLLGQSSLSAKGQTTFVLSSQALSGNPLDLGAFPGGTTLNLQMSGTISILGSPDFFTQPDGSLALPVQNPLWQYANPGSTDYPTTYGGDGINHYAGGGMNYSEQGDNWPFAGKMTTDTTDPATIRFGAVVGTFSANPQRSDWFYVGFGTTVTVPPGGAHLYLAENETVAADNSGYYLGVLNVVSPDLLFQNPSTGQLAQWTLSGLKAIAGTFLQPGQDSAWKAVTQADFNRDGQPDIVFQNRNTGQLAVWFMQGTKVLGGDFITPTQYPSWKCVGAGDFNGDGLPDLLFYNASTGKLAVWFMVGPMAVGSAFIMPAQNPGWNAVGVADFNGDGKPDILFQNPGTGQLAVWFMNGTAVSGGTYLAKTQASGWQVVALADLTSNGERDIIFQNQTTGQLAAWLLQRVTIVGGGYITPAPPSGWQVIGPR